MENRRPLTEQQELILAAIPRGRAQAKTVGRIMEQLAIPKHERRNFYRLIEDLIFNHGVPIGSSSDDLTKGLFIIQDVEDLKLAARTLQSRYKRLAARRVAIYEDYYESLKNGGFYHGGK